MSDHLTQIQIESYGRRQLSAVDLLPVTDHLGVCDACRQQVARALNGDASYLALRSGVFDQVELSTPIPEREHLNFDQIFGLVDSVLADDELQAVNDHLSCCQPCRLAVADLRAFKDQVEPEFNRQFSPPLLAAAETRRRLRFWSKSLVFSSALAALLLLACGWMVWRALRTNQRTDDGPGLLGKTDQAEPPTGASPAAGLTGSAPVTIALLNDGAGQLKLDGEGRLTGAEQLPPAYQQMIKQALGSREFERSPLLAGLTASESIPRGGSEEVGDRFPLIEPVRTMTLSEHPTFRWARLKGATDYVVEIYDENFDPVASSPHLSETKWKVGQGLKRGKTYCWQVKAIKDGKEMISPRPPAPQVKFRVLDEAKANELGRARETYGSSHLTLGLLYAEAGLLDEAESEFRALEKANAGSPIVEQLLRRLR